MEERILYSQCWEDPLILNEALKVNTEDIVLSISSAGDNSLYLLTMNPKKIISIDSNYLQNFILEFKVAGIKTLNHKDFLELIGILESDKREELYNKIRVKLNPKCREYWDKNPTLIRQGIIHSGKFESYLSKFRNYIIPLSHSKKDIKELLSLNSLDEQKFFYNDKWNNLMWRITFKIFFSKTIMKIFGRDKNFFDHNKNKNISEHYYKRTFDGLTKIPIKNNYFLNYILLKKYDLNNLPEYLKEKNFDLIKQNIDKLKIITSDINTYLKKQEDNSFSKFNLSDIFELFSQEDYEKMLREILKKSKNNAIICYWNNLVYRNKHPSTNNKIVKDFQISKKLFSKDRVFFYNDFIVEQIKK